MNDAENTIRNRVREILRDERNCLLADPRKGTRTPDYKLEVAEERIIVEVKEIAPNKEERESDRLLKLRGYGNVLSHTPGNRVRKKVADCSAQIKARALGEHPSILVVFDRGRVCGI